MVPSVRWIKIKNRACSHLAARMFLWHLKATPPLAIRTASENSPLSSRCAMDPARESGLSARGGDSGRPAAGEGRARSYGQDQKTLT